MIQFNFAKLLDEGVSSWNSWRAANPNIPIELYNADLTRRNLAGINFADVQLAYAMFGFSNLSSADLRGANLAHCNFYESDLSGANLNFALMRNAVFVRANLINASLREAFLWDADLTAANLRSATLVQTDLSRAKLNQCSIFGISAWEVILEDAEQADLNIARVGDPPITVDNLEVAQFVYLLLSSKRIREVIDTVSRKVVLILGRFTPDRQTVLDAVREKLRHMNYVPIVFDFESLRPETLRKL